MFQQNKVARLQFISNTTDERMLIQQIKTFCEAGGLWVQLQLKNASPAPVHSLAKTFAFFRVFRVLRFLFLRDEGDGHNGCILIFPFKKDFFKE